MVIETLAPSQPAAAVRPLTVAVCGATGLVGQTMMTVLGGFRFFCPKFIRRGRCVAGCFTLCLATRLWNRRMRQYVFTHCRVAKSKFSRKVV